MYCGEYKIIVEIDSGLFGSLINILGNNPINIYIRKDIQTSLYINQKCEHKYNEIESLLIEYYISGINDINIDNN